MKIFFCLIIPVKNKKKQQVIQKNFLYDFFYCG